LYYFLYEIIQINCSLSCFTIKLWNDCCLWWVWRVWWNI